MAVAVEDQTSTPASKECPENAAGISVNASVGQSRLLEKQFEGDPGGSQPACLNSLELRNRSGQPVEVAYPQLPHASTLPLPMPDLVTKDWYSSPPETPNSQFFGVIEWDKVPMIRIGISEKELRAICPIVNPYKEVNVLLYSINPVGIRYEIGILMDGGRVSDVSYKARMGRSIFR